MTDSWRRSSSGSAVDVGSITQARPRHSTAASVLPVLSHESDGSSGSTSNSASTATHSLSTDTNNTSINVGAVVLHGDHLDDGDTAREARQLNETYLWLLVLAAAGECVTTCFVPQWRAVRDWRLNVSATALNLVGPFLDGLTYGYEDLPKSGASSIACQQFRSSFLGVFTSFPFMVDHAGDLSAIRMLYGPLYILSSMLGACGAFHAGRSLVPLLATRSSTIRHVTRAWQSIAITERLPSLRTAVTAFIGCTIVLAAVGPTGFVRDPKDPQFIGALRVAATDELFLGIFMSCSAILLSTVISTRLQQPSSSTAGSRSSDWTTLLDSGALACNGLACLLVYCAYAASQLAPDAVQHNLLVLKFVSSFCGSLSCFSASISFAVRRWHAGDRDSARWNVALHVLLALLFIPLLRKQATNQQQQQR